MKIETILNAMEKANIHIADSDFAFNPNLIDLNNKRVRQYHAFRDRIIRLDERNKMRIAELEGYIDTHNQRVIVEFDKGTRT